MILILAELMTVRTIPDQDIGPLSPDLYLYLNLNIGTVTVLFTAAQLEAR